MQQFQPDQQLYLLPAPFPWASSSFLSNVCSSFLRKQKHNWGTFELTWCLECTHGGGDNFSLLFSILELIHSWLRKLHFLIFSLSQLVGNREKKQWTRCVVFPSGDCKCFQVRLLLLTACCITRGSLLHTFCITADASTFDEQTGTFRAPICLASLLTRSLPSLAALWEVHKMQVGGP